MPVSSALNAKAAVQDLSSIMDRTPVGLNDSVRSSFKYIQSPDSNIGLLGFEFMQFGLRYKVRYQDDVGMDKYTYEVIVPTSHPHLHTSREMCIAEKAHAFVMVMAMMDEDIKTQNAKHLSRLAKACFDVDSGTVSFGVTCVLPFAQSARIVTHYVMQFPNDAAYKQDPGMYVLGMEWIAGPRHKFIDNSKPVSQFITSSLQSRNIERRYMAHADAVKAIEYAELFAERSDHTLYAVASKTNLWRKLERALLHVSFVETAAPHP